MKNISVEWWAEDIGWYFFVLINYTTKKFLQSTSTRQDDRSCDLRFTLTYDSPGDS